MWSRLPCFNGGSGITPTESASATTVFILDRRFNGGSGITPTESAIMRTSLIGLSPLQWRVGYYPDRIF